MGLSIRMLSILYLVTFMMLSCAKNIDTVTVEPIERAIMSVYGDSCPVFEDDLVTTAERSVFDDCDLRRNPQAFDGKLVRLKSTYRFMIHGAYLSGGRCTELSYDVLNTVSVGFESERDFEYLRSFHFKPVDLIAVGRFSFVQPNRESDTIHDNTPFHFSLICLEKASAATSLK